MNNAYHSQYEKNNSKLKLKRTDTLRMTQEFNEKYFNEIRKNIETTDLYVMKDDIKNYKPLTSIQLQQLDKLTELEKIDIIHLYNTMFSTLEDVIGK
jgi:hypothetical protein